MKLWLENLVIINFLARQIFLYFYLKNLHCESTVQGNLKNLIYFIIYLSFKTILSIAPVSLVPCLFFYFSSSIFLQFCFVLSSMRPELYTRVFSYAFNLVSLTLVLHDFPLLFVRLLLFANMPLNFSLLTRSKFSRESGFLRPTTGSSHHYTF